MTISTIPIAYVQKFRGDYTLLAQQKESRLQNTVRDDPDRLEGSAGYFDRIGATEVQEILDRHGNTPIIEHPHSRRRIILRSFDHGSLIDRADMKRLLNAGVLPDKYRQNAVMAMNRKKDDLIIAAANGSAYSMDANLAASAVPLPAAQKIAAGGTGLTLAKLLQAKEILDGAEIDQDEEKTAVVTAKQVTNLLNTTEVKNADYNTVKALVEGRIDTFLGFRFARSERLTKDSASARLCLIYAKSGLGLARGDDMEIDITKRADKRNSWQVYVAMDMDATRIEDEKVVQLACVET